MTQSNNNQGIINSWSLIAFAQKNGKMQVGKFANKETGEEFTASIFTNGDVRTFVSFSSNLGELTPKEIVSMKDNLQVVQLKSGNYSLCKVGGNTWQDVDLGI